MRVGEEDRRLQSGNQQQEGRESLVGDQTVYAKVESHAPKHLPETDCAGQQDPHVTVLGQAVGRSDMGNGQIDRGHFSAMGAGAVVIARPRLALAEITDSRSASAEKCPAIRSVRLPMSLLLLLSQTVTLGSCCPAHTVPVNVSVRDFPSLAYTALITDKTFPPFLFC